MRKLLPLSKNVSISEALLSVQNLIVLYTMKASMREGEAFARVDLMRAKFFGKRIEEEVDCGEKEETKGRKERDSE